MEPIIAYIFLTDIILVNAGLYNAALFKPAIQSSDYQSCYFIQEVYGNTVRRNYKACYASLGVDGNSDGDMANGHCQHTGQELIPWWMVDLRGQFVVETIQITNRQDSYQGQEYAYRLRNFDIDIFQKDPRQLGNFPNVTGQVCYHQTDPLGPSMFNFTCSGSIVGRYVRLVMRPNVSDYLHICEMKVLVSSCRLEEINFTRIPNKNLTSQSLITLKSRDYNSCLWECLQVRSTNYCTAITWVTSTRLCQLFSVNPSLDLASTLVYQPGTHVYVQSNTF
ncbi:fucolectin-7 [Biomphalaria glabrata]|nr:fucolectin-7-like [Biomphalaria glabrata]